MLDPLPPAPSAGPAGRTASEFAAALELADALLAEEPWPVQRRKRWVCIAAPAPGTMPAAPEAAPVTGPQKPRAIQIPRVEVRANGCQSPLPHGRASEASVAVAVETAPERAGSEAQHPLPSRAPGHAGATDDIPVEPQRHGAPEQALPECEAPVEPRRHHAPEQAQAECEAPVEPRRHGVPEQAQPESEAPLEPRRHGVPEQALPECEAPVEPRRHGAPEQAQAECEAPLEPRRRGAPERALPAGEAPRTPWHDGPELRAAAAAEAGPARTRTGRRAPEPAAAAADGPRAQRAGAAFAARVVEKPEPARREKQRDAQAPAPQAPAAHQHPRRAEAPQPAGRIETAPEPPKPGPVRQVSLAIGEKVQVRMAERAGELRVMVSTPDANLGDSLRTGLPELVERLEGGGFVAETWHPAESRPDPGGHGRGGGAPPQQQERRGRQDRPQWLEELERSTGDES